MNGTNTDKLAFWSNATTAAGFAVVLFSIAMLVPPRPSVAYFNFIIYGSTSYPEGVAAEGDRYLTFIYGVLGSVMIGWLTLIILLARSLKRTASRSVASAMVLSTLLWFAADSTLSIVLGYWQNAASNGLFLGLLLPLMVQVRRHCTSE